MVVFSVAVFNINQHTEANRERNLLKKTAISHSGYEIH